MSKIKSESTLQVTLDLNLTEAEARALGAITTYGADAFVKCFYEHLGADNLKPHEAGLRSLFETIKQELPPHLIKIDKAREALKQSS